jgi:hypothetical protein
MELIDKLRILADADAGSIRRLMARMRTRIDEAKEVLRIKPGAPAPRAGNHRAHDLDAPSLARRLRPAPAQADLFG